MSITDACPLRCYFFSLFISLPLPLSLRLSLVKFLCGNELDYKFVTKWETVEALKAWAEDSPEYMAKVLAQQSHVAAEDVHLQNFMFEEM